VEALYQFYVYSHVRPYAHVGLNQDPLQNRKFHIAVPPRHPSSDLILQLQKCITKSFSSVQTMTSPCQNPGFIEYSKNPQRPSSSPSWRLHLLRATGTGLYFCISCTVKIQASDAAFVSMAGSADFFPSPRNCHEKNNHSPTKARCAWSLLLMLLYYYLPLLPWWLPWMLSTLLVLCAKIPGCPQYIEVPAGVGCRNSWVLFHG
jgi:hypothetical protein